MHFKIKQLFIFLMLGCCVVTLKAQQNAADLPSLINNQTSSTDNVEQLLRKKMFVKIVASKHKVFVGEPVLVMYQFYVATNINDRPFVTKQPEFSGCSVRDIDFGNDHDFESINNQSYSVFTFRKVQLTPLQPGKFSLGKAYVNNDIDVFNPDAPMAIKKYNIVVTNEDVALDVISLPEKNEPENFYGITGIFGIEDAVAENKIAVGETGHLLVTIKGSGNFDAINEPAIKWPVATDHFDGTDSQHIDESNFPFTGSKVFSIPFIGKREGKMMIPPVSFSFFNTATSNYETVRTDSIAVTFTKALAKKDEFKNIINYDISNRRYLWIVPAIALLIITIALISYKRNQPKTKANKPVVNTTEPPVFSQPQPVYHVKYRTDFSRHFAALDEIKESKPFFTKAKEILTKAIAERLDLMQYSERILLNELKQRTYNAPVSSKAAALFEAYNLHLYAPYETQIDFDFYFKELKSLVEELQAES